MNKADEMFEELGEAIKEFEKLVKLRKNKCGEITHDTCIVSTAQLETVLKHMENSISKEVIEEKIEKINKRNDTIYIGGRSNKKTFRQAVNDEVKKVLQELLKGK